MTTHVRLGLLLAALLAAVALGFGSGSRAQVYTWSTVTVDAPGDVGWWTSLAVDANGDPMISYCHNGNGDLKFAICDVSASANGKCDQPSEWSRVPVDTVGYVGLHTSLAVDANGDPMISYKDASENKGDLKFAICDLSASVNGNCNETGDWSTVRVDEEGLVGKHTSLAVDANGDPMISYYRHNNLPVEIKTLKFAICDLSASVNGNCNETGDWSTVTVDEVGDVGAWGSTSLAVDGSGDFMISYYDYTNRDVRFAICERSESAHGNCDEPGDWHKTPVNAPGDVDAAEYMSIAVDANGDPMISYCDQWPEHLRFAMCKRSASANGNCDQWSDWRRVLVDESGNVGTESSIAVRANGEAMISYFVTNIGSTINVLNFARCEVSGSAYDDCDEPGDWTTETVDAEAYVGWFTSIAVDPNDYPMISYFDFEHANLKFATAAPPRVPVGGIGIYRSSDGMWFLRNENTSGVADLTFSYGAGVGGVPVVGDWDGDGTDTIGLYRPSDGMWFLRNANSSGTAHLTFSYGAGISGAVTVVGDWNNDGTDTIGIHRASDGMWFLRNANSSGVADLTFSYGAGIGGVPVVGDWDNDGIDTIGIHRASDGMWFLRNANSSGVADLTFSYGAGISGGMPVAGDWDGS